MKKAITILFLAITALVNAQDFEGVLTYSVDFEVSQKMLDMGITKEMFKSRMESEGSWADTIKTSYRKGFYRQLNLSVDSSWLIYRSDSNKIYTFQSGEASDICIVTDPSVDQEFKMTGKMPTVILLDTVIKYKDYELKMVEVKWSMGTYYYLFDERYFKIDPELFSGHVYDGYYEFLKISKSLPIQIVKETGGMMTLKVFLIDSLEIRIEEGAFQVPDLVEDDDLSSLNLGAGKMMKIKE